MSKFKIQCLRCFSSIDVTGDMVGQTILCPSCTERVYVTDGTSAKEGTIRSDSNPIATPSMVMSQLPTSLQGSSEGSFPFALVAAACGATALIVILVFGVVLWKPKPVQDNSTTTVAGGPAPSQPEISGAPPGVPKAPPSGAPPALPPPPSGAPPGLSMGPGLGSKSTPAVPRGKLPPTSEQFAFAEVWKMPTYGTTGASVLTSVSDSETPCGFSLIFSPANLPLGSSLVVEADKESWIVKHSAPGIQPNARAPVAELRRNGPEFIMAWSLPLNEKVGPHLKNCLVELTEGTLLRVGQLREPIKKAPITLDLAAEKQIIEAQLDDPPRSGAGGGMRFEIVELSGFSTEAKVRPGTAPGMAPSPAAMPAFGGPGALPAGNPSLPVVSQAIIDFPEIPALELRAVMRESAGNFNVSVEPYFRETPTAAWRKLPPTAQLDRLESEERKTLSNARQRVQAPEKQLRYWENREEDLQGKEPAKTDRGHPAWSRNYNEAKGKAGEFKRTVDSENKVITKAEAMLDLIPKLREFIKGSHEQAKIRYVVYSECGDRDLLLIDGRGNQ